VWRFIADTAKDLLNVARMTSLEKLEPFGAQNIIEADWVTRAD